MKKIFTLLFVASLTFVVPVTALAENSLEAMESEFGQIDISVSGSQLRVSNAGGEMLYIYNVAGVRVWSVRVESSDKTYQLNLPKGCYIVKVGKTARKISIR